MTRNYFLALLAAGFVFLAGCVSPKINVVRNQSTNANNISRIALMPSGGLLADSIGIELLKYGFDVVDTNQVANFLLSDGLSEIEMIQPRNISKLKEDGIDSVLLVKSVAGYDNKPQSSSIKLLSAETGSILLGATWQNGHGGAKGSPADQDARVDIADAARQIAKAIGEELSKSPRK